MSVGATGSTRTHGLGSNVTSSSAVVDVSSSQPAGRSPHTKPSSSVAVTVPVCPGLYGPSGSAVYVMPSVTAKVSVGTVGSPATHTACVSVGAAGTTGVQGLGSNVTENVAVVADVVVQPVGITAGHTKPAERVAVTVTDWPGSYGGSGTAE
ncbi:hypothetical protein L600_000900001060 [Isoptericola variabilis J7]|nr:hypothetical protein L600_000900001060 [Isoptericola variabilis J7]